MEGIRRRLVSGDIASKKVLVMDLRRLCAVHTLLFGETRSSGLKLYWCAMGLRDAVEKTIGELLPQPKGKAFASLESDLALKLKAGRNSSPIVEDYKKVPDEARMKTWLGFLEAHPAYNAINK